MTKTLCLPKKHTLLLLAFFAVHGLFAQTIRYVNASLTTGLNNGTSWVNAYKDLQPALAAAQSGDQIWVAKGTYYPTTSTTDRTASFVMKNNVGIYGGFAGTEATSSLRDWKNNTTILSGDIDHATDPLVVTGIGATLSITGNAGNSYHVVFNTSNRLINSTAVLDGFSITGGCSNGTNLNNWGAGIYNETASPSLANCIMSGNFADNSGCGMINLSSSSPNIINCVFLKNCGGGGTYGAGNIYGGAGGGMSSFSSSSPILINCVFSGNRVSGGGHGDGGAINTYSSVLSLTNCIFSGNYAGENGGAIYTAYSNPSTITNCVFVGNNAAGNGGAFYNYYYSPALKSCIVWGNSSGVYNYSAINTATISYSNIQGGYTGTGNINQDPLFLNSANPAGTDGIFGTADDGLALQSASPCINKGSNAAIPTGITTDIAGLPRIMDGTVDMGAYESASGITTPFAGCPNVNLAIARSGYNFYNGEPMTMYNIDTTTGAAAVIGGGPLKDPYTNKNMEVNGIGLNSQDGFLYAIRDTISTKDTTANATFYRIGSNYAAVPLGLIQPPPPPSVPNVKYLVDPSAGTFDDQGNFYFFGVYLTYAASANLAHIDHWFLGKISNVATLSASTGTIVPTYLDLTNTNCLFGAGISGIITSDSGKSAASLLQDITYNKATKMLYAYQVYPKGSTAIPGATDYTGQLLSIDPATGNFSCGILPVAFGGVNNQPSGISTTANGSLILMMTSGDMYKSDLNTDGTYKGTFTKIGVSGIASLAGQAGSIRGDLASCGFGKVVSAPGGVINPQHTGVVGYPNPARDFVTLSVSHVLNNAIVRLVTLAGNVISETTGVSGNTFKMDLSKGASGIYMVEIVEATGSSRIKIIKE